MSSDSVFSPAGRTGLASTREQEDHPRREDDGDGLGVRPGLPEPGRRQGGGEDEAHLVDGDHDPRLPPRQGAQQQNQGTRKARPDSLIFPGVFALVCYIQDLQWRKKP